MIKNLFNLTLLFLLGTSLSYAQITKCELANSQTNVVPANNLLGSIANANGSVDNDEKSFSSLIVNANIADMGLVSQDLIFPTLSTPGQKVTIKFGYSGAGLPNLASVSNAITVESLNGATPNGDAAAINSSLIEVVGSSQAFLYTFTPATTFDRIRVTVGVSTLPVLGALAQIDIYYACKGNSVPNNLDARSISPSSVSVLRSQTCLGPLCTVVDSNLVMDRDLSTAATINIPVGLLGSTATLAVSLPNGKPKDTVTIVFGEAIQLLELETGGITVETYNAGASNGDLVTLSTDLLSVVSDNQNIYSYRPTKAFDEVRVNVTYSVVGANLTLEELSVNEVYRNPFIARPAAVVGGKTCLPVVNTNTTGTTMTLASVTNPGNAIDADETNYSTLNITLGLLGAVTAQQYIGLAQNGCGGDTIAFTFQDDNSNPVSVSALGQITLQILDSTSVIFSQQASASVVTVAQVGSQSVAKVPAPAKYNGVRFILNSAQTVGALNAVRFFGVCASSVIPPTPNVTASTLIACNGGSATFALDTVAGYTYEWFKTPTPNPGQTPIFVGNVFTTPARTIVGPDTFYVRAVNPDACTNNFLNIMPYVVLDSIPTPVVSPTTRFVCENVSTVLTFPAVSPFTGAWFSAAVGGTQLSVDTNLTIQQSFPDTNVYYAQQSSNQCPSKRAKLTVITQQRTAAPVLTCNPQSSINGTIVFNVTGVSPFVATGLEYEDQNVPGVVNVLPAGVLNSITLNGFQPNQSITIRARAITAASACTSSAFSLPQTCQNKDCPPGSDALVNFAVAPDTILCTGQSVTFFDLTPNAISWNWNFGDGSANATVKSPTHTYATVGSYTVTLTVVLDNCFTPQMEQKFNYISSSDCGLLLPNAFTPNGDNLNDDFGMLINSGIVNSYLLEIYNQWGQRIFSSTDPTNRWDGTFEGNQQPSGTYAYRYRVRFKNEITDQEGKGNVLIIR